MRKAIMYFRKKSGVFFYDCQLFQHYYVLFMVSVYRFPQCITAGRKILQILSNAER